MFRLVEVVHSQLPAHDSVLYMRFWQLEARLGEFATFFGVTYMFDEDVADALFIRPVLRHFFQLLCDLIVDGVDRGNVPEDLLDILGGQDRTSRLVWPLNFFFKYLAKITKQEHIFS